MRKICNICRYIFIVIPFLFFIFVGLPILPSMSIFKLSHLVANLNTQKKRPELSFQSLPFTYPTILLQKSPNDWYKIGTNSRKLVQSIVLFFDILLLIQFSTSWYVVINHQKVKFFFSLFLMDCTEKHSAGFNSHHCSWRQVCNSDQGLAYQFFWLIISVDSA